MTRSRVPWECERGRGRCREKNESEQSEKNSESQKDGMVFKEDFNSFQSRKELKEAEAEEQSMIFLQGVITRDLIRLILVADRPHSQTRGIRK